ncbi:MAG: PilZ domain-containing protein [Terriglobia bacterium]
MDTTQRAKPSWLRRRSQRIPLVVPLQVSSLDPKVEFSERCETTSVSRHGCLVRSRKALPKGMPIRLDIPHTDRAAAARVVHTEPAGPNEKIFSIAMELYQAENFWGVRFPPDDWGQEEGPKPGADPALAALQRRIGEEMKAKKAAKAAKEKASAVSPITGAEASETPPPSAAPLLASAEEIAPAEPTRPEVSSEPAAPAQAPTLGASSAALEERTADFEQALKEKAQAIAAEFEQSYRASLGDLLAKVRADLEQHATTDWERLRSQAHEELHNIAAQTRQALGNELETRRQQTTELEAKLNTLQETRQQIEQRLNTFRETLAHELTQAREPLLAQGREQVQDALAELRKQVDAEAARRAQAATGFQAELEEIRKDRDYVESLIRRLPQTVDQRVEEGIAGTLDQLRKRVAEEFSAQTQTQTEELEKALTAQTERVAHDLRQKLFEDFDRQEREIMDRISVRLEELRQLETTLQQFREQTGQQLQTTARQLTEELQGRLRADLSRQHQDVKAALDRRERELQQGAQQTLLNLGRKAWDVLHQQLQAAFDQRQHKLLGALETARTEVARLDDRAQELAQRLDKDLEATLSTAISQTTGKARQEIEQAADALRTKTLAAARQEIDETVGPIVSRGEAVTYDLHQTLEEVQKNRAYVDEKVAEVRERTAKAEERLQQALTASIQQAREQYQQSAEQLHRSHLQKLEEAAKGTFTPLIERGEWTSAELRNLLDSVQRERERLDSHNQELKQHAEEAEGRLRKETKEFQQSVREALLEATGQIRGRIHQAVEMAEEPVARRAREARDELERLATQQQDEFNRRLEESRQRLEGLTSDFEGTLTARLESRLAELVQRFQQETEKLSEGSTGKLQATLDEALDSVAQTLRQKLGRRS